MKTKYIIEVEDRPFELLSEDGFTSEKLYRVKGFNSLVFDWNGLNMLTPYTEPDMEQVRKEAYENGYENGFIAGHLKAEKSGQSFYEDGYQCGLNDAWEAARKICTNWVLSDSVLSKIFGMDKTIDDIMKESTASEAIEKIRAYEQRQEEIKVGDEVEAMAGNAVVIEVIDGGQTVRYMYPDTITGRNKACNVTRTGRHFPEIAEVLRKMKESDNG